MPDLDERLLDAVRAAPDDDAPRLVYADRLLERGDPRGR
ncbi:MAG: TIGR02996 domain-containing protein [Myxococcota bacterium]